MSFLTFFFRLAIQNFQLQVEDDLTDGRMGCQAWEEIGRVFVFSGGSPSKVFCGRFSQSKETKSKKTSNLFARETEKH